MKRIANKSTDVRKAFAIVENVQNHARSKDEARECSPEASTDDYSKLAAVNGAKGGVASGKSRKLRAETRRLLADALCMRPDYNGIAHSIAPEDILNKFEARHYLACIVANLVNKAANGNSQALNQVMKLLD